MIKLRSCVNFSDMSSKQINFEEIVWIVLWDIKNVFLWILGNQNEHVNIRKSVPGKEIFDGFGDFESVQEIWHKQ